MTEKARPARTQYQLTPSAQRILRFGKNSPRCRRPAPVISFEDFRIGQVIRHATPRTVTTGDVALYNGLFGLRLPCNRPTNSPRRSAIGACRSTTSRVLCRVGKTVPDVSPNAVANLGYAGCFFRSAVFPGDALSALPKSSGSKRIQPQGRHRLCAHHRLQTGTARPRSNMPAGSWCEKRDEAAPAPGDHVPRLANVPMPNP